MELFASVTGVFAIVFSAVGMSSHNVKKSKIFIGLGTLCVIPVLYISGGLHGALQIIVIASLFFLGATGYKQGEMVLKFFLPIFTIYLLYKLQEPSGLLLVLAGIMTPIATILQDNLKMKLILLVSVVCWLLYAYIHSAWYTVVFDVVAFVGIGYSLFKEYRFRRAIVAEDRI
ncbi:MAG: YgjV family protein [Campylobacterales bacterium]